MTSGLDQSPPHWTSPQQTRWRSLVAAASTPHSLLSMTVVLVCIIAAAVFLFAGLGSFPIVMWDESRLAVNALEMATQGIGLVTTYRFEPDLWNTKPALQIWMMASALQILPSAEFAIRLPSAAAALATTFGVGYFVTKVTRSVWPGILAGIMLLASRDYYGVHVAMTGDYDALLTAFTTFYVFAGFWIVHRRSGNRLACIAFGFLVAAAVLTKGVAGLMPGVGIFLYALLVGRLLRIVRNPNVYLGAALAVGPVVMFYAVREMASPGFLAAMWANEFRRYVDVLDEAAELSSPLAFLMRMTVDRGFSLGILAIAIIPAGWLVARRRRRLVIAYATIVSVSFIAVISFSNTRYVWYDAPAIPLLAVAAATALHAVWAALRPGHGRLRGLSRPWLRAAFVSLLVLLSGTLCARAVLNRHFKPIDQGPYYESAYGPLLDQLVGRGFRTIAVVDPGRGGGLGAATDGRYNPILHFYAVLHRHRHQAVITILPDVSDAVSDSPVVATCSPAISLDAVKGKAAALGGGCRAVIVEASLPAGQAER